MPKQKSLESYRMPLVFTRDVYCDYFDGFLALFSFIPNLVIFVYVSQRKGFVNWQQHIVEQKQDKTWFSSGETWLNALVVLRNWVTAKLSIYQFE